MKKFAFVSNGIQQTYQSLLVKYRTHNHMFDVLKISALIVVLFFTAFVYLYYVNLSSTRGYFLRQENQKLSNIEFQHEILKTNVLENKQNNRETMHSVDHTRNAIEVRAEIVQIPSFTELTVRD